MRISGSGAKFIYSGDLRKILEKLPDNLMLEPNMVGNISIYSGDTPEGSTLYPKYLGYIDLLADRLYLDVTDDELDEINISDIPYKTGRCYG